ncbi:uncharacterized protein LOC113562198 [Ooceraea biroi]|uniref:uncharacterized protein LOC113562198 n=1 Tax=Ooceraea biroi TaxID=2015173 RepID=UPI000F08A4E6|nr:uncharacterized protein LOC113562198 [Ooceraea biroi]
MQLGDLTVRFATINSQPTIRLDTPSGRLTLSAPTVRFLYGLRHCVQRVIATMTGVVGRAEAKLRAFRHIAAGVEDPSSVLRAISGSADFDRNDLLDCELLVMLSPNDALVKWEYFQILHNKDKTLPAEMRVCPKLTINHLILTNMAKMRVPLAAQILEESLNKLNTWEQHVQNGDISEKKFLTRQTADGLRVTIKSTLDIVNYLTLDAGFDSVLTGRLNQDSLEVFLNPLKPNEQIVYWNN